MKLKELDLKQLKFVRSELKYGSIVNVSYEDSPFTFQIPKGTIVFIENETLIIDISNERFEYLLKSIEQFFQSRFNKPVQSILNNHLKLKLKFSKYLKPEFKVLFGNNFYNFYNLTPGDTIICFVSLDKLWITEVVNYNLTVKEINLNNKSN